MLFPITNSVSPTMNRQVIDRLSIVGRNPAVVPFVVQGAAGHTAAVAVVRQGVGGTGNLQEWQDSAGTAFLSIKSDAKTIKFAGADGSGQGIEWQGGVLFVRQGYNQQLQLGTHVSINGTLQMVSGSPTIYCNDGTTPITSFTIRAANTAQGPIGPLRLFGGSVAGGTANLAGSNVIIAGGQSSGNSTPSSVVFQGTVPIAAGATLQTLVDIGTVSGVSGLTITQPVNTLGTPAGLTVTGGAHTTLTASTESPDINFNLARTVQFATGALATQRAVRIQAPTYSFVGASVITTAVTFDIGGAPVAGTNATITNSYALRVNGKINFPDVDVDLSSTTGTKWGRLTDKQAWWGATPIIQPAHANQAAVTDNTTGTPSFTLNDVGAVFSQSTSNGNFATLARQINEIRNVLVSLGKMKGSA